MTRTHSVFAVLVAGLALAAAPIAHAGGTLAPGDLLGSTGGLGGTLVNIDPLTGASTLQASVGMFGPVTEIVFRDDGVMFGTTGGGSSNVITIDPETGAESLVGQHPFGAVTGLAFADGILYGAFFFAGQPPTEGFPPSSLVIVDQNDGSLTLVGELFYNPVRGLAYDSSTGTMYGVGTPTQPGEGLNDVLFTVDLMTAATTEVGDTGFQLGGLRFGPDGTLYGGEVQFGGGGGGEGAFDANLVQLDPGTGAGTAIGLTGTQGISGLAFVPGGGPVVPTVGVPTLSFVGLGLLAALLVLAGLVALRRS